MSRALFCIYCGHRYPARTAAAIWADARVEFNSWPLGRYPLLSEPSKLVDRLRAIGLATAGAIDRAPDEDLLTVRSVGPATVATLRELVAACWDWTLATRDASESPPGLDEGRP